MKKEIKNRITPRDAKKYFKCGEYHGSNGMNAEETAFGIYMYIIENTLGIWQMDKERLDSPYTQAQVDMLVAVLENYVLTECYNKENKTVTYDSNQFAKQFENFNPVNSFMPLSNSMLLMPYAIQYILAQNGIQFEDRHYLIDTNDHSFLRMNVKGGNAKVNVSDTIEEIEYKLNKNQNVF